MPSRFFNEKDINTFDKFNKELVGDLSTGKDGVINQTVVVYKVSVYDLLLNNPQLNNRIDHVIYVGENLIITKQTSVDQDNINTNISSWIEPYDYGSYWIILAEISNYNKAEELMSYFRREFDDLLFGKTIRLRENKTTRILIIEVGPYASDTMADAVTAIFDSRLQDAKPIKLIDPNFRPSKDFSNFEPKSSAYKVNRGRNMALIQSLSNVTIHTVFEGGLLGNENAIVVKILPNKVILSNLGKASPITSSIVAIGFSLNKVSKSLNICCLNFNAFEPPIFISRKPCFSSNLETDLRAFSGFPLSPNSSASSCIPLGRGASKESI